MRFMSSYTMANSKHSTTAAVSNGRNNYPMIPITPYTHRVASANRDRLPPPPPPPVVEKKVVWGSAVWYALHTISVKIKEEEFARVRSELLEFINLICTNLPCPDCSSHAKTYLEKINFKTILTKEDLKKMLHQFHNSVNARKGYALFPYEKVDEMYSLANTVAILHNFILHFQDRKYRSIKLLATDLNRALLTNELKKWFKQNISAFDP